MCGICGFIDYTERSNAEVLFQQVKSLHHRGPDDQGTEMHRAGNASIGLGQARLSILDISSAGHQPMHYRDLSIVLNGEIYNFKEIRNELCPGVIHLFQNRILEVICMRLRNGAFRVSKFIGMFLCNPG
jgi:asparagine synthase (glutamine-hydrolysing)